MTAQRKGADRLTWRVLASLALLSLVLIACETKPASPQGRSEVPSIPKVVVEKEKGERVSPPPDVRIRLKKDGKAGYSWEISGSDADQILKVNEKLRKRLGEEGSK
ncbi:MAG: hypothetical protein ACE144_12530 [Thermodesulfobacteriota bacterium]